MRIGVAFVWEKEEGQLAWSDVEGRQCLGFFLIEKELTKAQRVLLPVNLGSR